MVIMQKISYYLIYSKRFHGCGGVLVIETKSVMCFIAPFTKIMYWFLSS